MMRILLFLATNFAVMLVLGIILNVTGIAGNSTGGILIMAMLFGFAGSLISLFLSKTMALRSVGAEVITEPRNQAERWLVETVRRQAQQAGIPMPDVAIYHSNDANAFATGATKNNSLVAISTGLLNSMTEEEAEAVLAHEVSHIANGDMAVSYTHLDVYKRQLHGKLHLRCVVSYCEYSNRDFCCGLWFRVPWCNPFSLSLIHILFMNRLSH